MATVTTIHQVIEGFEQAPSTAEKGAKFEHLMVDYFNLDPTLAVTYDEVTTWAQWAHNEHTHDSGIDLVARNRETGAWTAIQCKFYHPKHYLQKGDIDSFFTASGKTWDGVAFENRIIISTTDRWSHHAENALSNQAIPVQRIGLAEIAESPIEWLREGRDALDVRSRKAVRYGLRDHQKEALEKIQHGLAEHDRGKWISACGTGKTFTSLKLAERRCADNGGHLKVLFLAPSISLVSQTLREWMAQTQTPIRPFVVCSDTKAGRQAEDITTHDIPLPTTDAGRLATQMRMAGHRGKQMTVVFSTYQSIDVVARAQKESGVPFDLILCDEAHRTTGATLPGQAEESAFVKVHDNTYLPAAKRLYMTATPRIYGEEVKKKAVEQSAVLASMDNEETYGPEFHRLGFGEAVERSLLTDYKVMILCVANEAISDTLQASLADEDHELNLDDAARIVGCWNGLAKRTTDLDFGPDPVPMRRAVAFAQSIKASEAFAGSFPEIVGTLVEQKDTPDLEVSVRHVDGTMNALTRADQLAWLKAPAPDDECRILTNARCLSEGVDVPSLDAVLFLAPRNSLVDVVQSVGRVMRRAPGKDFGYIILPVAIDANESPEQAMRNNKRFKVVWDVLNALRAHDDRFKAMINSIDLDGSTKGKIGVEVFGRDATDTSQDTKQTLAAQLPLFAADMKNAILARIVKKVGERDYWENWADDVVHIHTNQTTRIKTILERAQAERATIANQFDAFLAGLRANLNDSIGAEQAIDMLSQHLITRPVFEALFPAGSFADQNPVSLTMQAMVNALAGQGLEAETAGLERFYASVRTSAAGVATPAGRQAIIHRLYEEFFRKAFPKQASSLGVVYTPIEIVDFILRAADQVCRDQFGYGLSDEGVHILDPFTGTGTFIVRLLESGIIRPADLARKYSSELWANELMLLAYYIACVNIETTYQAVSAQHLSPPEGEAAPYLPFPGATLTDTFQITEAGDRADTSLIPANNERIEQQLAAPIRVIIGNPPYSAGQSSANDNNANLSYPTLDGRIADTYAKLSNARSSRTTYDSYFRAFRWAADRIGNQGVVAFVSNNGWVDSNSADGLRKTFFREFSHIWVYNLRGNQRTAGEVSRREGGKVFGSGARTGVAILVAMKAPGVAECQVRYHQVPDYQTAEDKLAELGGTGVATVSWQPIVPNEAGDWIGQRSREYIQYPPIGSKDSAESLSPIFNLYSLGINTGRDAWCYNFEAGSVENNMRAMIDAYNVEAGSCGGKVECLDRDPRRISWSDGLQRHVTAGRKLSFEDDRVYRSIYRPFMSEYGYFHRHMNERVYQQERIYPTPAHSNVGISVIEPGARSPFAVLMVSHLPDSKMFVDAAQFFPRWTYVPCEQGMLDLEGAAGELGHRRIDNISQTAVQAYRDKFGPQVDAGDIFHYVYGILHSPQYRSAFAADLKRMLPRIPFVATAADFEAFVEAGRRLAKLHTDYENVDPYPLHETTHPLGVDEWDLYRVEKMRWADKGTKKTLVYNRHLTLSDVPATAHEYMLGSRSALDWLIDRYQVKTDKDSGIVNDPNAWCREHDDPRYILDLVKRVTRVSVATMSIVHALPTLSLEGPAS